MQYGKFFKKMQYGGAFVEALTAGSRHPYSNCSQQEKTVCPIPRGYFPISLSSETTPVRPEPAECSRLRGSRRLSLRQACKRLGVGRSSILVCVHFLLFSKAHFPQRDCLCCQVMRKYLKIPFLSHLKLISDRLNIR